LRAMIHAQRQQLFGASTHPELKPDVAQKLQSIGKIHSITHSLHSYLQPP